MLTYAGVPLTVPTAEQQASIQAWLDSWSDLEFSGIQWPGKDLLGITFNPTWPQPHPQLGSLYWPYGASRWAVGHFVVSNNQLELIRFEVQRSLTDDNPLAAPLVMSTGDAFHTIAPALFMLPPRPIHQINGNNPLWLLTLVDARYYWWNQTCGVQTIDSSTTWEYLYAGLASGLDISIAVDPINAAYVQPAPEITAYYQSLPILLDAVAFNCGQRIVRGLDGTVRAKNNSTDLATLNGNIFQINNYASKVLGGSFSRATDFASVMPEIISNVTRVWLNDVPTLIAPLYHVEAPLLTNQAGFGDIVGCQGTKTFRDTFHGTEASAFAGERALAAQVALDYWLRLWNGFLDVTLAHALNVVPEGLHDIEWSYTRDRVSTRIMRPAWNWSPDELLHADGNGPFSGNTITQPWREEPFFAQVSSAVGTAYPWTEVIPATGGSWSAKTSGRTGTDSMDPAYEFNASADVTAGSIVLMWRGFQNAGSPRQEWVFAAMGSGGGGSLTVQDSDGSDICTGISVIKVDVNNMDAQCTGPGEVTISASADSSLYVVYQDHALKAIPCIAGVPTGPPYSGGTISSMSTKPGLDFTSSTHTLGTNPTTGGGSGTATNCVPSGPPPTGYYCHSNPGGNVCNTNPYLEAGDTSVTGPYPDSTTCSAICSGGPPPPPAANQMYSETPGISWNVIQSTSEGDTGPCTVKMTATVTYPPPNQNQLVNGYVPGQGTLYRLNLVDSCTMTWLVNVNTDCATIDISPNWNGLVVYGGTDCPYPDCSSPEDHLGNANALVFSRCDFKVVDVGASCGPLRALKINTCGLTTVASFSFLKSDCSGGTFTIKVRDGLVQDIIIT